MARGTHITSRQRVTSTPRSMVSHRPPHGLRLVLLLQELAAAGSGGLTHQELLARPALHTLYTSGRTASASSQALRRDLILLSGASPRQHQTSQRTQATTAPNGTAALVRYDAAMQRYALAVAAAPLHLTTDALQALCILADALRGGKTLPGGADLFAQLRDTLAPDQQAILTQALQGRPHDQATPTLQLDLPALEEENLDTLRHLTRAIRQRQTIDFDYQPRQNSASTRHRGDEPLEIWMSAHAYVAVWCEEAQRELDLRLDRIVPGSVRLHPRSATRRQRRGERIRYWLAPEIAQGGVSARLEKQEVRHQEDGSAIVSGIARSRFWARRLLLSYGSNARALYPPTLVAEMRQVAQEMARLYEDTGRKWEIGEKAEKG